MTQILIVVAAYLLGSFPSGLIIGKFFYKTDLRTLGSKNIGATNAYRILGPFAAAIVFALDFLKGYVGALLGNPEPLLMVFCGAAALAGHLWSVFLGFRGGRGVATGVGVFACLNPLAALGTTLVWILMVKWKRIVSLASIVAAIALPLFTWTLKSPLEYILFGTFGSLIVILRHRDNIIRLLRGEEKEITKGKR